VLTNSKKGSMKRYFVLVILICAVQMYAQVSATATWNLTANQSTTVTGNILAGDQSFTNMQCTYVSSVQRSSPTPTAGSWPAETTENATRYMQFAVSPTVGNSLTVSTITMNLYATGGSNMKANVYYSTDSAFATKTQIGTTLSLTQTAPSTPNVSVSPSLLVNGGQTVYVRVYPYYTTAATGKYVVANSVKISGTTAALIAVIPSTTALSNFIQTTSTPSAVQTFTVTGTNLTSNVVIVPPASYEISTDGGTNWVGSSSEITLTVASGSVVGQPITMSVRLNASAAGSYVGLLSLASSGADTALVSLGGIYLSAEPTIASSVAFSEVTGTAFYLTTSGGNGAKRIVVLRAGSAVNWTPTDAVSVSGVNANFTSATDQGNGNKVVYDGADNGVVVTGLSSGVTYYAAVYEYNAASWNSTNYLATAGVGSQQTLTVPSLTVAPTSIAFGNGVINSDSLTKSYTLSGVFLTANGSISVTAPANFLVSLSSTAGYASSVNVPYTGSTLSATTIYARFVPTASQSYSGSIANAGGGTTEVDIPVTGNGVPISLDINTPVGFATGNGGTTGGTGGTITVITDAQQLADIMKLREKGVTTPAIFYISGTISGYTTEISVKRTANVSIIGLGTDAGFLGFGMKVVDCQNVIIRNMTFADCKVDEKDGLCIDGSTNVWVDHCSFTDSPSVDASDANHDGELDCKNSAAWCTFSYNHFQNHRKTCLLGHTPSQTSDTALKVTYFRNWFDGTYSRHPRIRFAKAHILNNLYTNVGVLAGVTGGYGIGVTCQAQVVSEANYFENTATPILISTINDPGETLSGDPVGYIKSINDTVVSSGAIVQNAAGVTFDPNAYYAYTAASAALVKSVVTSNAGAGLLNFTTDIKSQPSVIRATSCALSQNYPNPFNPSTMISYDIAGGQNGVRHVTLKVYDVLGKEVAVLVNSDQSAGHYQTVFSGAGLPSGIYFYRLEAGSYSQIKKMILMK
jgi:pectate lyase